MIRLRQDIVIPGTKIIIPNKNRIPNVVKETMSNIWRNYELKPLVTKISRNADNTVFTFIIHLPIGVISFREFAEKEHYFRDAVGTEIEVWQRGTACIMEVFAHKLKSFYPFLPRFAESNDKMFLPIPIGYSAKGAVTADVAEMYSLLIGGIPRSGKSNLIHTIIVSLLINCAQKCIIFGIDYKESEYAIYLENYGMLATTEQETLSLLTLLNEELDRRKRLIKGRYVKVHDMPENARPPFIIIFVDEVTEIQNKELQYLLNRIPRLGGAFGFITIIATQRPSAKTFRSGNFTELRSLIDARICFNVRSVEDSKMILGNSKGIHLPRIKGRCVYQNEVETEVQTLYLDPRKVVSLLEKEGVTPHEVCKSIKQSQNLLPPR